MIEEFLEGEELSLLALCDGENVLPLAPAQDYKRIFDGDEGPNTGGMGSYSPVPGFDPAEVERIADARPPPDRRGDDAAAGTPYHGVLYAGLMMTAAGAEGARVQLPLRRPRDAGGAAAAALRPARPLPGGARARAAWPGAEAEFADDWAVTVVLASAGYPASSSKGDVISGLDEAAAVDGVEVTHAGTAAARRGDRHRRRPRAQRDRARRRRPAEARAAPTMRPS